MDIDIKQERDDENSRDSASGQYEQTIKLESTKCESGVNVVIKHEDELVIDETWTMDDEECEYQRKCESDVSYGYYHIKYFDEEEDKCEEANNDDYPIDGDDNDYAAEDESDDESDEDTAGSSTKAKITKTIKKSNDVDDDTYCPNVIVIDKFLRHKVVVIECHLCPQKFSHIYRWTRHIKEKHSDFMVPVQAIYDYWTENLAVCKLCKKELRYNSNHMLHYILNHEEQPTKYLRCTFCNYKDFKLSSIQQHLKAKHPRSSIFKQKCPLCSALMNEQCFKFHIMYQHTEEFQEKFNYNCHLCTHLSFGNSQPQYIHHLMNEHNLNNHEVLRFERFRETGEVYKCKKCFKLFVNESLTTLLEHYLSHDIRFSWSCKFCENKYKFQENNSMHTCSKMLKFFRKQPQKIIDADLIQPTRSENMTPAQPEDVKLTNWQEFDQYVKHICPFCNNEFSKFQLWQIHMRERHRLNTLDGLQMATVPEEPHKLQCLMCLTLIAKNTINLHTHRFQHLPFKPYKCNLCFKSLCNYNGALQHIISKCRVEDPVISAGKQLQEKSCRKLKIASDVEKHIQISCYLCNGEQFSRPGQINQHYQVKHNDFMEYFSKSSIGDATECKICPSSMRRFDRHIGAGHFVQHLNQKPYKCKICQRSYSYHRKCKLHITKYHNVVEIESGEMVEAIPTEVEAIPTEYQEFIGYACPECNESLSTHQLWLNHIKGQHNFFDKSNVAFLDHATDKHKCKECNVSLTTSTTQQQQHKLSHMPYKSYICLLCYYRFNRLPVLHRHLNKRHFTKGLFICPICPKISCNTFERSEHIKQEHPQSEWPKNMCVLCFIIFAHLNKHMETHEMHRSKYNCAICSVSFIYLKDYEVHMTRKHKAVEQSTEPTTCKAIAVDSRKRNLIEHAKNMKKKKVEATTA